MAEAGAQPAAGSEAAEYPDLDTVSADYAQRFAGPVGAWFLDVHARLTRALDYGVTVLGSSGACKGRLAPRLEDRWCRFEVGDLLQLPARTGHLTRC